MEPVGYAFAFLIHRSNSKCKMQQAFAPSKAKQGENLFIFLNLSHVNCADVSTQRILLVKTN